MEPRPDGYFSLMFPEVCYNVDPELLSRSKLFQPYLELAELNTEVEPDERYTIHLNSPYGLQFYEVFKAMSQLIDEPQKPFEELRTSLELANLLRISEHFGFTEMSQRMMVALARRIETGVADGTLCKILGVEADMTAEQQEEAERHCDIFKEPES